VALASISGGLLASQHIEYVWHHAAWAAMSVLASSFIFTGILPFIERIFRIATPLTLLEWRDPTRPLLQLLAREAPGTYNHSLVVGNMAEAACEAIGANGLLAQVGALYHDIGKVYKPDYFTENSGGSTSRHDNLAPSMSLLIILAHVKDGLELAKEYKLPVVLHSFIEEHHGTTVVRYFHHRASELQPQIASGRHDREVSENEFRYAGPKPRTLETAVMMMCDSVEGAVRSLSEPTPGRIESMVHTIFMERLSDGQFDDCPITLKEIRLAEEAIVKTLCSVYHGRVAYPKAIKNDDSQRSPGTAGSAARVAG
jgi:putative nucleotidyltransferase with HDIG domain